MLAKVDASTVTITEQQNILYNRTDTIYWDFSNFKTIYTTTAKTANYEFYLNTTLYGKDGQQLRVLINGEQQLYSQNNTLTQSLSLNIWDIIDVQTKYNKVGSNIQAKVTEKISTLYKNIFTHISKPRQLKTIWEKATGTLFGYHTDYTRYTGE